MYAGHDATKQLTQRLRHNADSENGRLCRIQQFHLPIGVLLQAARDAAKQISANLGHLDPGGVAALEFRSLIGSAGIVAVADPEKI